MTSWLIALLAAGMASQSVQFLNNAGVVVALDSTVWDTSWLLSEGSLFGQMLHALIGYTERPTEMQLMVYIATLFAMFLLMRLARTVAARAGRRRRRITHALRRRPPSAAKAASGARSISLSSARAGPRGLTLALLPIAHGLDRHFDLFGEGRLRQPAARPHMAHERRRIVVIDGLFAAVGHDLDDPPVGLQPHPHHGRFPMLDGCRPMD